MTLRQALAPCPFCGGEPVLGGNDADGFWIECPKCLVGTVIAFAAKDDPKPGLVERWNQRAHPEPSREGLREQIAALKFNSDGEELGRQMADRILALLPAEAPGLRAIAKRFYDCLRNLTDGTGDGYLPHIEAGRKAIEDNGWLDRPDAPAPSAEPLREAAIAVLEVPRIYADFSRITWTR